VLGAAGRQFADSCPPADNVNGAFPSMKPLFFIAARYLFGRTKGQERYLAGAAFGIALSLIPIMVTLIVADGMIQGITERFLELGTGHIEVYRNNYDFGALLSENGDLKAGGIPTDKDMISIIEKEQGVRGVWREIDGMGIALGKSGKKGVAIRAVENSFLEDPGSAKYLSAVEGEAHFENDNDVLIGSDLAKAAGVKAGDKLRIMTLNTGANGSALPRSALFNVRGIVSSGYHEIDAMWCLMNLEAGKKFFAAGSGAPVWGGANEFFLVKVDDPFNGAEAIADKFNGEYSPAYHAWTWMQLQSAQYSSYQSTKQMLLFIMALIILVAAVNVSSATSMLVIERERDLLILKSFGARPGFINAVFLTGSFLTALIGTATGILAGLLLGVNINGVLHKLEEFINIFTGLFHAGKVKILDPGFYLETIPIVIDWNSVIFIGLFTIFCALVSSKIGCSSLLKRTIAQVA